MRGAVASLAGPVSFECIEDGTHQLMLFHTEQFSSLVRSWISKQIQL
jgi:hypothetical protein